MKRLFAIVIVCSFVASACTASVDEVVERADTETAGADAEALDDVVEDDASASNDEAARDFSVLASLELIPASAADEAGTTLQVSIGDIEAAADQARLRPPLDPSDEEDLVDFFNPLTGRSLDDRPARVFVPLPSRVRDQAFSRLDEFIEEVGFSPGDISSFVALESPPAEFLVFRGVTARQDLPEIAPGIQTIGEGDDLAVDLVVRTAARPLGRPLRVAQQDGYLALSVTTPPLVDWPDGAGATLADDPILAGMATRLDEEQVVGAYLLSDLAGPSGTGFGWRADDRGPQGVIVFSYETEGTAAATFDAVAASFEGDSRSTDLPIADFILLDSIDLRRNEIVAVVNFADGRSPFVLLDMFFRADGPFSVS